MKALQKEDTVLEYSPNDAIMQETLVKIHAIILTPKDQQSIARSVLTKAKFDQLVLHLMAAPEYMLPSC